MLQMDKMIYFDHNATTHIIDEVKLLACNHFEQLLNPSSIHSFGRNSRKLLEDARKQIAVALGIKLGNGSYKILFASGGTEVNNLVINNFRDGVVLYSAAEHASVREVAETLPESFEIKVNKDGIIDFFSLEELLTLQKGKKILISVAVANNETGIIQPVKKVVEMARKYGALVHTDAVQAVGKIKFDIKDLDVDYVTISGHKIGGFVGVGALVTRDHIKIIPQILGGGQERSERAGTENVIGIISLAKAIEIAISNLDEYSNKMKYLRDILEEEIENISPYSVISRVCDRIPNTSLIVLRGVSSDRQLIEFDLAGIAVSKGSACSSGKVRDSHLLQVMGYGKEITGSVIRVSLGKENTMDDVKRFIHVWKEIHAKRAIG